jgi:hypothetical protein
MRGLGGRARDFVVRAVVGARQKWASTIILSANTRASYCRRALRSSDHALDCPPDAADPLLARAPRADRPMAAPAPPPAAAPAAAAAADGGAAKRPRVEGADGGSGGGGGTSLGAAFDDAAADD